MYITPAISPKDFEDTVEKLYPLVGVNRLVQINVSDSAVEMYRTWIPRGVEILSPMFNYEFDCMLENWKEFIPKLMHMAVERVVVHIDSFSQKDVIDLLSIVKKRNIAMGLSTSNDQPVDFLLEAVHYMQTNEVSVFIQVEGSTLSKENTHVFDERVLSRIKVLRKFFPSVIIQVDGCMNLETVSLVKEAGANGIVADSYFNTENPMQALDLLRVEIEKEVKKVEVEKPDVIVKVPEKKIPKDKIVSKKRSEEKIEFLTDTLEI